MDLAFSCTKSKPPDIWSSERSLMTSSRSDIKEAKTEDTADFAVGGMAQQSPTFHVFKHLSSIDSLKQRTGRMACDHDARLKH
jgi:hypothetical protein